MRTNLLVSLLACLCLSACAEHSGSNIVANDSPKPPVNEPDGTAFGPENGDNNNSSTATNSPTPAPETGSNPETPETPTAPGTVGGGGGQPGGQPVPEPSTLLLVGTGLAAASLLRRRRPNKA